MRRLLLLAALFLAATPIQAHVGSPNVFYDGAAGPYPVRVIVRPPAVIPGNAEVTVRVLDGRKADRVTVQPVLFKVGFRGAPEPDVARPVPGAPDVWSRQLLLMKEGSWNIRVHVQGLEGEGTALVPLPAVRSQLFEMGKSLGLLLAGFGLFLFAGAVSIVGAAVREARLPPGETADVRHRFRARWVAVLAALLFALVIWGGKVWWNNAELRLRQTLFKPFTAHTTVRLKAGRPLLALAIEDSRGEWWPLIPDHGKLMHLFLLREPGLDAFAHLHPLAQQGQRNFLASLPPLPEGMYRVYADIVDENGFPQTLVDHVRIPAAWVAEAQGEAQGGAAAPAPDPDDSWRASDPLSRVAIAGPQASRLENGGAMLFQREPLVANRETTLRFEVRGPDGGPAVLEPYMGMLGHAVINRDDGGVFVHLHPMGTLNMAAQQVFAQTEGGAQPVMDHSSMQEMDGSSMQGMNHAVSRGTGTGSAVSFPYAFPQPGRYRLWVQVKSGGQVLTGVFAAEVGKG